MGGLHAIPLSICITLLFVINGEAVTPRETLEIIIGGGGASPLPPPPDYQDCPPPPPPPCPPPPSPPKQYPPPPPPPERPLSPAPPKRQPPQPPKRQPPPPPPPAGDYGGYESELLALAAPVIKAFKKKVTYDPKNITKTWMGKNICRDYKGFICDTVPNRNQKGIAGVNFNNYNFNGKHLTLSELLIGLKDLAFFHANSNNFTGSIPLKISTLQYLYELDLSNNNFSGDFPHEVFGAKRLVFLDLRFNNYFGMVPSQVFLLNLDLLFINDNNFKQTLPENLGSTTALYLTLANNHFVGEIPRSIGGAANTLLEVLFLNNQLTGCLPYEIGLLKKSTVFDVGSNDLTGPIPHSFQCLEKMEILNLAHNKFYNEVPEAVCNLPKLSNFTVSYNYFTQVGPQCRELIKKGVLDVKMNCILDLPNQRSPTDCARFFSNLPSCRDKKSLTYIPCSKGYSGNQLETSNVQWATPSPAPAPLWRSYGALSPH
ncbi:unnamed protein product [Lactuca saligna]|uniref:Leucine-rich repeat-containing N-terminal plant-type domain-containing protein n=1 Tax=Lactuca saligna TaxID=75948 RepID=A0AA35Z6J2_LACSI|nr:unnamed protein product [Lactuca saligna]